MMSVKQFGRARRRFTMGVALVFILGAGCANLPHETIPSSMPLIPARDFLLDAQSFPTGWVVFPCASNCERREGERMALRSFGIADTPGHVIQEVFRLEDIAVAQAKFRTVREVDFKKSPQSPSSEFLPPPEITYHSPIADDYYFGCGVDIVPACRAIMRYRNVFVEFFFNVDTGYADGIKIEGDGLKIQEVVPILRALDKHVGSLFGITPPSN